MRDETWKRRRTVPMECDVCTHRFDVRVIGDEHEPEGTPCPVCACTQTTRRDIEFDDRDDLA